MRTTKNPQSCTPCLKKGLPTPAPPFLKASFAFSFAFGGFLSACVMLLKQDRVELLC